VTDFDQTYEGINKSGSQSGRDKFRGTAAKLKFGTGQITGKLAASLRTIVGPASFTPYRLFCRPMVELITRCSEELRYDCDQLGRIYGLGKMASKSGRLGFFTLFVHRMRGKSDNRCVKSISL
jgi:hypothetical protein